MSTGASQAVVEACASRTATLTVVQPVRPTTPASVSGALSGPDGDQRAPLPVAVEPSPAPLTIDAEEGTQSAEAIESIEPFEQESEAALVASLKAGEASAYERVVREIGPRLLTTAQRMLGSEDDARDAVQDAFLSAFRNIGAFDAKSKLSTWLHRIVINASLMKLRTKRRKPAISIEDLMPRFRDDGHRELPVASWRRGEARVEDGEESELRSLVRSEIEELPDEYRTVLMLRDVEGLDTLETARVLSLSESAVKTRLHRARLALRERLDQYMRSGEGA